MKKQLHFLLADDHAIVRSGLRTILKDEFDDATVTEASNASEVMGYLRQLEVDLLVCDITMPATTGLELCKKVRDLRPNMPVLVLSMHGEEQYAIRALRAGASGYLTKESAPDELIKAVHNLLAGRKYVSSSLALLMANRVGKTNDQELHEQLSDREMEVLRCIVKGQSLNKIGEIMHLSPNTISTYRARILEKMKMKTNAALIQYALEHRL